MKKKYKRCVGSHISVFTRSELIEHISFVLNYKNIRYTSEYNKTYDYYVLWFWLTDEEYKIVCDTYWHVKV